MQHRLKASKQGSRHVVRLAGSSLTLAYEAQQKLAASMMSNLHVLAGQEMLNNEFKLLMALTPPPSWPAMHVQNVDPTWVSPRANRCPQTDWESASCYARTRLNAYLLTEPKDHSAQRRMPTRCVIGRLCHRVTVCQVARYRSFFTV